MSLIINNNPKIKKVHAMIIPDRYVMRMEEMTIEEWNQHLPLLKDKRTY